MQEDYGVLLENPRRRRRKGGRRRRAHRSRRRRNPFGVGYGMNPRRRRRRGHRGYRRGRGRMRRNPGFLGGITRGFGDVGSVLLADAAGDGLTRLAGRFGLKAAVQNALKATPETAYAVTRIAVGYAGPMLLRAVGVRLGSFGRWFRTINVAAGVAALTFPMREKLYSSVGLSGLDGLGGLGDYASNTGYEYGGSLSEGDDDAEDLGREDDLLGLGQSLETEGVLLD